ELHSAPVKSVHGQCTTRLHYLKRASKVVPLEGAPQDGMTIQHVLPRGNEKVGVHLFAEASNLLHYVDSGPGRIHAVEEHSLLHRRQWIYVLDISGTPGHNLEFLLTQAAQRKI